MKTPFYSQHGEDIIIDRVIGRVGYFVEVGMIDGRRFSNTLALEQRGWRGLCVEAHPDYVDLVRRNRPNSTVIHAAAGDTCGVMPFYADPRGDLSSLIARDPEDMRRRFGQWFRGYDTLRVSVRRLDHMLYQAAAPRPIDAVSIDVEGCELAVLRGLNLEYWQPRLLIVEADDDHARWELDTHLRAHGYHAARRVGVNVIYVRSPLDALRVRLVRVDREVLHTAHPTDTTIDDETYLPAAYETRREYAKRLLGLPRAA